VRLGAGTAIGASFAVEGAGVVAGVVSGASPVIYRQEDASIRITSIDKIASFFTIHLLLYS